MGKRRYSANQRVNTAVSYGGSSLIIMSVAVAILLRIDFELRVDGVQAIDRGDSKSAKGKARRKAFSSASS